MKEDWFSFTKVYIHFPPQTIVKTPKTPVKITKTAESTAAEPLIPQISLKVAVSNVVKHDKNVPKNDKTVPPLADLKYLL